MSASSTVEDWYVSELQNNSSFKSLRYNNKQHTLKNPPQPTTTAKHIAIQTQNLLSSEGLDVLNRSGNHPPSRRVPNEPSDKAFKSMTAKSHPFDLNNQETRNYSHALGHNAIISHTDPRCQIHGNRTMFPLPIQPGPSQSRFNGFDPNLDPRFVPAIFANQEHKSNNQFPGPTTCSEQHKSDAALLNSSPVLLKHRSPTTRISGRSDFNRPLQPNDEVHIIDADGNDSTGSITFRIQAIENADYCMVTPVLRPFRAPVNSLIRAPLPQDIPVSIFQQRRSVLQGREKPTIKIRDFGMLQERTVENGQRRYAVRSQFDGNKGTLITGLADHDIAEGW